jgi:3-oxoacid CoA-transferase subunit A
VTATTDVLGEAVVDGLLELTLDRPDALNSLNLELKERLAQVLRRATHDGAIRPILVTGAGRAFCAGGDISEMDPRRTPEQAGCGSTGCCRRSTEGMPQTPNPPTAMLDPSAMSATASAAHATTLFITRSPPASRPGEDGVAPLGEGRNTFGVVTRRACNGLRVRLDALLGTAASGLEAVSNNCGLDDWGLGRLLAVGRIRRMISSYVGENKEFARQYLAGELEVELTPQGTLAERLRAGGSGILAFYTPTGVGTQVADGGLPWRFRADGEVALASPPKEVREFRDRSYVLEHAISTDFALVSAWKGDRHGNLIYRMSAQNFNPLCAMAGAVTIAEVEHVVEPGELNPAKVHTPGVYVQRVVALTAQQAADKRIEKLTTWSQP